MSYIFIAHVEEDHDIAFEVTLQLEQAGYETWIDDLDTSFGENYMTEIVRAIGNSQVLILVISPDSLGSTQVNSEVEKAFEKGLKFITILRGITDAEYKRRKPNWDYMFGRGVSAPIPPEGVPGIIERIIKGLKSFGIQPRKPDAARINRLIKLRDEINTRPEIKTGQISEKPSPLHEIKKPRSGKWGIIVSLIGVVVIIAVIVIILNRILQGQTQTPSPSNTPALTSTVVHTSTPAPASSMSTTPAVTNTPTSANTPTTSSASTPATGLKPDLVIQDITWSPQNPSMGNDVTFTITLTNRGKNKALSSYIAYYIDGVFKNSISVNTIDTGATGKATFTWKAELGTHKIKAIADFNNSVDESDETNNEKEIVFSNTVAADLVILDITWTPPNPTIDDLITYTVTVKNQGTGTAEEFYVYFDIDGGGYSSVYHIGGNLYPGQTTTAIFKYDFNNRGTHIIKVIADYHPSSITESDETNNSKTVTIFVQ